MYCCRRLAATLSAVLACLVPLTAAGQGGAPTPSDPPQWSDHHLPDDLAGAPMDQRVEYMRQHLLGPADDAVRQQLETMRARMPSQQAIVEQMPQASPDPIRSDRLVIETFVDAGLTDDVVAALCGLQSLDDQVDVQVEHRNYVVLNAQTVTAELTQPSECLSQWQAMSDYGGQIAQARGVTSLPYVAAHYGGTTVHGALTSFDHKLRQLLMRYGL